MLFPFETMRAFRFLGFFFMLLALLPACSDRSRQNPLDPENPNTRGKPVGLSVISILDTVRMSWQPVHLEDLTGYTVQRKLEGDSDFSSLAEVPANVSRFEDRSNRFGVLHSYRIVAKVGELASPPSEEVAITPGPTVAWLADVNDGTLIKLAHDGRHELLRTFAFPSPLRVRIDDRRDNVWVLDQLTGNFGRVNRAGRDRRVYESFEQPIDFVLDLQDGCIWIADTVESSLRRYDASGVLQARNDNLPKLALLAVNPFHDELWAVTQNGRDMLKISELAVELGRVSLFVTTNDVPLDLDVHVATGTAWLALGKRVVRLNEEGRFLYASTHPFRRALRVATDQNTAECWVVDESLGFRTSSIVKLDAQGNVLQLFEGFDRPQGLVVNPFDSSCYVVDTLRGRVVRISREGVMQILFSGLITPVDIDIALLPY
jgi:DNA-binding beta-propeller fold protein YncE